MYGMEEKPAVGGGASRPLACGLAVAAALVRLIPHPYNLTPLGALGIYAGARLRSWQALALPMAVMAVTDVILWKVRGDSPFDPYVYACFLIDVLLGMLLRRTQSPVRIGVLSLLPAVLFYLVTNFGVWLHASADPATVYYPASWQTLVACYAAGLPFFNGEPPAKFVADAPPLGFFGNMLLGDVAFCALLFGLHAGLSRLYFPGERVRSAARF
jgi:hypothetical protein